MIQRIGASEFRGPPLRTKKVEGMPKSASYLPRGSRKLYIPELYTPFVTRPNYVPKHEPKTGTVSPLPSTTPKENGVLILPCHFQMIRAVLFSRSSDDHDRLSDRPSTWILWKRVILHSDFLPSSSWQRPNGQDKMTRPFSRDPYHTLFHVQSRWKPFRARSIEVGHYLNELQNLIMKAIHGHENRSWTNGPEILSRVKEAVQCNSGH